MAPSHRALWKSLPTEWQSMLRSAHNLDGPPDRQQLADIFSASSLDLYPPDGVELSAFRDLAPLRYFPRWSGSTSPRASTSTPCLRCRASPP